MTGGHSEPDAPLADPNPAGGESGPESPVATGVDGMAATPTLAQLAELRIAASSSWCAVLGLAAIVLIALLVMICPRTDEHDHEDTEW